MIFTWTVNGSFNITFGESSVFLGILFVAAAIALAQGWELLTLGIYGHHHKYTVHYGLYFTFWDKLLGTQDPNYEKE
jgi:uncharacterized membrane protein